MTRMRLAKAHRLLKLNREMQKLEEGKLAIARAEQAALQAEQDLLIGKLGGGDTELQSLPAPLALKRLRKLGDQKRAAEVEVSARSSALRAVATRSKYSERLTKQCEVQHRRASEEKDLLEAIERVLMKRSASLP